MASGLERVESFDVDPTTETIYYTGGINSVTGSHFQNLYTLDFGESNPTLVCEDCAWDVDFVADDEWLRPGDTDLDHDIDITDFNALASNFSPELERAGFEGYAFKTVRQGDFTGDWKIDISDFNTLAANFAPTGYPGPFGGMTLSDVPEPTNVFLLALALVGVTTSWRLARHDGG